MVTETLNYKSNDTKQPHVQPQNSQDMSCSSRHVDALQLCLATDVSASLQVCPGQASQWASTCVEPKHAKSSCQMCPTHSKAIRIPSSKVREVSLGIVASAHETRSSVWWSLSSLRRLDFCINGVKENRHTRLRRVRTTSGTLNLSLKIKNEAEESGLLISRSGTWLWERASALFQTEGPLDSEQLMLKCRVWGSTLAICAVQLNTEQARATTCFNPPSFHCHFIWVWHGMTVWYSMYYNVLCICDCLNHLLNLLPLSSHSCLWRRTISRPIWTTSHSNLREPFSILVQRGSTLMYFGHNWTRSIMTAWHDPPKTLPLMWFPCASSGSGPCILTFFNLSGNTCGNPVPLWSKSMVWLYWCQS